MTFYSAFQWNAFQWNAYQIARNGTPPTNGGSPIFLYPFQIKEIEDEKRKLIKKQKNDLDRLDSVLAETQRLRQLAAESKIAAKAKRALELEIKEQEYLKEINRLLAVRVELIERIKKNTQFVIALALMKKRKFRVLH